MGTRPLTLGWYISRRFMITVAVIFLSCLMLIFLVDFIDLLRRGSSVDEASVFRLAELAIFRVPSRSEQVLPFAVLIATIATYLGLSSKSELVVARSVGLSVWQFLMPSLISAFLIGVIAITLFNPFSAYLKEQFLRMEAEVFGGSSMVFSSSGSGVWLRQDGIDGQTVFHARHAVDKGTELRNLTIFAFNHDGAYVERLESESAILRNNYWELSDVWILSGDREPQHHDSYSVSTYLTATQVQESFSDPETVSFWDLPKFVELASRAGLSATGYQMQYQQLLARPFYLCAMVLIAATTSLRVFRFGNVGRMVLGGVLVGFLLFIISKLLGDLGKAGLLNPVFAAWSPGIVGALAGLSILLYQEDG